MIPLVCCCFPSADRTGIQDLGALEQLQEGLINALRSLVTRRRPDDSAVFPKLLLRLPDLRTLNNLHSDKLLAFRIDPWVQAVWVAQRFYRGRTSLVLRENCTLFSLKMGRQEWLCSPKHMPKKRGETDQFQQEGGQEKKQTMTALSSQLAGDTSVDPTYRHLSF